jgi:hypothetical protein
VISTLGNRSCTMAEKRGKSSFKNLGTFESLMALMSTASSFKLGLALFKEPAMTSTDLTALMPKS